MKARIISAVTAAMVTVSAVSVIGASAYDYGDTNNVFTFTDTAVTAENNSGEGYKLEGTALTINAAGTYVITGNCVEGTITVKKGTTGVTLVLDDLNLKSSTSAPLSINKSAEATIVIEGENTLTDVEDPNNENSEDTEIADAFEGAAIKVKSGSSVTFTGTGTLTADGSKCKNGIKGGSTAAITVGASSNDTFTINASSANDALSSDGGVIVNGGTINLTSDGDGLKTSPDEDDEESSGIVTINGGTLNITSAEDAIQADDGFSMTDGTIMATSAGGYNNKSSVSASDISAKGIKSDSFINIAGGTINLNAADDGIHLNGETGSESISITGGNITINAGDDGIHSDYELNVDGGVIDVQNSYEGLEGAKITLKSGSGSIYSTDDGMNAANSSLSNYAFELNISGGTWFINAGGDGLDSNGDLNFSGGYTEVFGAADGGNAALDYGDRNCYFNVTGGTIVGIGMSNMAVTPTSGAYIVFGSSGMMGGQPGFGGNQNFPGMGGSQQGGQSSSSFTLNANDKVEIKDENGNVLYTTTAVKTANSVVYSSPQLTTNSTYYLWVNDASVTSTTATGEATKPSISDCSVSLSGYSFDYTGSEITPSVTVKNGSTTLTQGTDYTVSYSNNVNAGTATVTVTGMGNYIGSTSVSFTINSVVTIKNISDCSVSLSGYSFDYTGSAITPTVTVKNGSTTLTQGTDYTVSYSNNVNAGTATVTVTGIGNYTGSTSVSFTINSVVTSNDIADCTITLSGTSFEYTGSAIKPKVTVKNGSTTLTSGTDYLVRYANNVEAGTATVVIAGRGDYTGRVEKTFTIVKSANNIASCDITLSKTTFTYTGNACKPKVTVKSGSTTLTSGTDYVVRYVDNVNVGTATVVIAGKGSYTGRVEKTFQIVNNLTNLSSCTISIPKTTYSYTGSRIKPKVTVMYGSQTLTLNTDYSVQYGTNTDRGTGTIKISGKGAYTGTVTLTFTIQ